MQGVIPVFTLLINICVVNAQSLRNKVCDYNDLILERKLDFLFVSESWLKHTDPDYVFRVNNLCPPGYKYIDAPRPTKKSGGGIAIVYKDSFTVKELPPPRKTFLFESLCVQVNSKLVILTIYRVPGRTNLNGFMRDLDDYLSQLMTQYSTVIVCGDLNVHFENSNDQVATSLHSMMTDFGFEDHIQGKPTHRNNGSLDALMSKGLTCRGATLIEDLQLSDHFAIFSKFALESTEKPQNAKAPTRYYDFRDYKKLDTPEFYDYVLPLIAKLTAFSVRSSSSDEVATQLNNLLSDSLDKFAPISRRKTSKQKSHKYRYVPEIADAKRVRRAIERQYIKDKSEINKQQLKAQTEVVRKLVDYHRSVYYQDKILSDQSPRQLFKIIQSLTTKPTDNLLPTDTDDGHLAQAFSLSFSSKVADIVQGFDDCNPSPVEIISRAKFESFSLLDSSDVAKLRKIKCSPLDYLPTPVFARLWPYLTPLVTNIINLSLSSGIFPDVLKCAHVRPLIKAPSLDPESHKSYRPVSNLSLISKIVETAINDQLQEYFRSNELLSPYQSAYRKGHSVESALSHVYSSILKELDRGRSVFLIMLDLSAAFDTISHSRLIEVLQKRFGLKSKALDLIKSYLSNRVAYVKINNSFSQPTNPSVGVPQGSVLGPVLFNCIMAQLPSLLKEIGIDSHIYADDTQFWISFRPEDEAIARRRVQRAFKVVGSFMTDNSLKLNAAKTQFLPISRYDVDFAPLTISGDVMIEPSNQVRNLGVIFDRKLNFRSHAGQVRKAGFFHLRRLKCLGRIIPSHCLETLIHAYVSSRIDFCNILLHDHTDQLQTLFQSVHNACAKSITGARRYDSAKEQLVTLHWLPVKQRCAYKALLFCHRIAHRDPFVPSYFSSVRVKQCVRSTRQSGTLLESSYRPNLITVGYRSFEAYAPSLWNALPEVLRCINNIGTFKKHLKTHLFKKHFL